MLISVLQSVRRVDTASILLFFLPFFLQSPRIQSSPCLEHERTSNGTSPELLVCLLEKSEKSIYPGHQLDFISATPAPLLLSDVLYSLKILVSMH
jgi:hypothetical protein